MNRRSVCRIGTLILGSFILSYLLFLLFVPFFNIWHHQINDRLLNLRYKLFGKSRIYPYIVHLDLSESSFQQLNVSYWDRTGYAQLISILSKARVTAVAFDIVFKNRTYPENDRPFIDATESFGNAYYPVILPIYNGKDQSQKEKEYEETIREQLWYPEILKKGKPLEATGLISTFSDLSGAARGLGHITCYPDRDGVYRRFPLLIRYGDGFVPGLSFRMLVDYLKVTQDRIEVIFGKNIVLHDARFPDGTAKDIAIPIDREGNMIINYAGPWSDSFTHYSFESLLELADDEDMLELLQEEMEGDLVLVSDVSIQGRDVGTTPFETVYPLSGLHANIINNVLTENFLRETPLWAALLFDLTLVLLILYFSMRFRPLLFTILSILLFVVFLAFNIWMFMFQNSLMPIARSTMGFLFIVITVNAYRFITEEKEKALLRRTFEHYFAPSLLDKVLRTPERIRHSEKKVLTILFSDIAGFTSWCAHQNPETIRAMLNRYYKEMVEIIFRYQGTIDKFIGDGIMVFFGDPIDYEDHALRAIRAAVEMQRRVAELRETFRSRYDMDLKIRIGINTGEVVVGNMGSESRVDYTVLGSGVNLAQRLESSAPKGGILLSEGVAALVQNDIELQHSGKIRVKGIVEPISVYKVAHL